MKEKHFIDYSIRRHPKARRVKLSVYMGGRVVLTLPQRESLKRGEVFLEKNIGWILEKVEKMKKAGEGRLVLGFDKRDYLSRKKQARAFVLSELEKINDFYGFDFGKVFIRNQKSRWGSCSSNGNLNFNYRIIDLPKRHAQYVIAHELCHLKHFDHGRNFWDLVSLTIPEYKKIVKEIKNL